MGYWTDRRKEEDSEIAGVMVSIFPIEVRSMGAGGTDSDVPDEVLREFYSSLKESPVRLGLNNTRKEETPDDIAYNEEWWKWYCQENKLDVTTGKSKDSKFLYINPLF